MNEPHTRQYPNLSPPPSDPPIDADGPSILEWFSWLWLIAGLTLAGYFFVKAMPDDGEAASPPASLAVSQTSPVQETRESITPAAITSQAQPPALRTAPIQQIRLGQRVASRNPQVTDAQRAAIGPEPDPATWRQVNLAMAKPTGDAISIALLRPLYWLADRGVAPGRMIELDLEEMGAAGPAVVLWIAPCPPIEPADASLSDPGRVVTGTFAHTAGNVIDVHVQAMAAPLGTTDNHPFWSEDRQAFIEAGKLRIGEKLRLVSGELTTVEAINQRGPPEPVYNLEVHGEHVYFVGWRGVLVHNSYGKKATGSKGVNLNRGDGRHGVRSQ